MDIDNNDKNIIEIFKNLPIIKKRMKPKQKKLNEESEIEYILSGEKPEIVVVT